jgi:hypothetical protein
MKNKLTRYLVIALVALNVVCIYFLMQPHHPPHHPPKITDIIDFDEPTKSKIDEMEETHFHQMGIYTKEIKSIRRTIYLSKKYKSDKIDYDSIFKELAQKHKEIEKMRFQYFSDIQRLCNAKQGKELDLFVKRMIEHEATPRNKRK